MKLFKSIAFILVAVVFAACEHHSEPIVSPTPPQSQTLPLNLGPSPLLESRSNPNGLQELHNSFAVIATKINSSSQKEYVMSRDAQGSQPYEVRYDETSLAWFYNDIVYGSNQQQYLKYWDLSASQYSFYAIAPYRDNITFENDYPIIQNITPDVSWLECRYQRDADPCQDFDLLDGNTPHTKIECSGLSNAVPLVFHHLLCQLQFYIYTKSSQDFTVTYCTVELTGDYKLITNAIYQGETATFSGSGNSLSIADSNELSKEVKHDVNKDKPTAVFLFSNMVIPQNITNQPILVTINTAEHGSYNSEFQLTQNWDSNMIYKYYFVLNVDNAEIILVDIETEPWRKGTETSETQTNW